MYSSLDPAFSMTPLTMAPVFSSLSPPASSSSFSFPFSSSSSSSASIADQPSAGLRGLLLLLLGAGMLGDAAVLEHDLDLVVAGALQRPDQPPGDARRCPVEAEAHQPGVDLLVYFRGAEAGVCRVGVFLLQDL